MNAHFDPAFRADLAASQAPAVRSVYKRSRGADPVATIGALALGLATVAAFTFLSPQFVKKEQRQPVVVTLMELPDDPPPAPPEQQPDPALPPPPVAQVSAPPPVITMPERAVVQAPATASPVTPPAPPRPAAPPAPSGPENAGDLSAKMISARPPRYPVDSRRAREEGTVVLSVLLAIDGRVSDIAVARSSGFPRLDRAALDAVRDWRWSPMMRDGSPVMVRGVVTIPFVLQRGDDHGRRGHHVRGGDQDQPSGGNAGSDRT
jgi:protein TonB